MRLNTMEPDPAWDAAAFADAVATLAQWSGTVTFKIWGDDGCGDCQRQLPSFAAALEAAGIDPDRIEQYPVDRLPDGKKRGPRVEEYGVERIPTVVVERDGREITRFVEKESVSIAEFLAQQLNDLGAPA